MSGDWRVKNGGDQSSTMVCPGCGKEISNTRWPDHFRSDACDGGQI